MVPGDEVETSICCVLTLYRCHVVFWGEGCIEVLTDEVTRCAVHDDKNV